MEIPEAIMDRLSEFDRFPGERGQGDEERCLPGYRTEAFARRKFGEMENLCLWLIRELEAVL
jgi:hypothetical protein